MKQTIADETYAALVTPRFPDGSLDTGGLSSVARFVASRGIASVGVNGATGEFCLTTPAELALMMRSVREALPDTSVVLCGVGGAGIVAAKEMASIAEAEGAKGLLVPSPVFFRYGQEDLRAFVEDLASSTSLPVLIYNLPQFSSGFSKETVASLICEVPNVVGVKDSSGSLEILRHLTEEGIEAKRFIGNDAVLVSAFEAGLCDGVISGVACAVPELLRCVVDAFATQDTEGLAKYAEALAGCIRELEALPVPWGIKWLLEAREVSRAGFAQPVSPERLEQAKALCAWFPRWFAGLQLGDYKFRL